MRPSFFGLGLLLLASCGTRPIAGVDARVPGVILPVVQWGAPVNGLRLGVRAEGEQITVAVENVGDASWYVNAGTSVANGQRMVADAVGLEVEDAAGARRRYGHSLLQAVAGRLDDLLVPLPPGATFALRFTADDFLSDGYPFHRLDLRAARRITATFDSPKVRYVNLDTPGIETFHVWVGVLRSGPAPLGG